MIPAEYSLDVAPTGDDLTGTLIVAVIIIIVLLGGILANRRVERRRQERLHQLRQREWVDKQTARLKRWRRSRMTGAPGNSNAPDTLGEYYLPVEASKRHRTTAVFDQFNLDTPEQD